MIKKAVASLLGLSLFSSPASASAQKSAPADADRWVLYERSAVDGKPLVVVARTGNAEVELLLRDGLATVVSCRANPDNVNDQGMPQGTDRLYSMEDELDVEPKLLAARAVRVASVTGQGERRMFFVHRDSIDLAPILARFPVQGYDCSASGVADRQALIRLITPTALERQLNGDQEVIANLQKAGDDGHLPRKTSFWFYGKKGALNLLADRLRPSGFSIDHWLTDPTGVVLAREMAVDFVSFRSTTPLLVECAEQSGVEYDGWETPVIAQVPEQSGRGVKH